MKKQIQQLIPCLWKHKQPPFLLFFFFFLFFIPSRSSFAYNPIDSLIHLLKTPLEQEEKIEILNKLSKDLNRINPKKSFFYAEEARTLAIQHNNIEGQCSALINLAGAETLIGKKSKALLYANKAIQLAERYQLKAALADAYHKKGVVYHFMELYDESLENYQNALSLNRSLNRLEKIHNQLNNIASVKRQLKDYDSALAYLDQSFVIAKDLDKKDFSSAYYTNRGFLYIDKKDYQAALLSGQKALDAYQFIEDSLAISITYNLLALAKLGLGELEEALNCANRSKILSENITYKDGIIIALQTRSDIFFQQKKYKQSIIEATKALVLSDSLATKLNRHKILNTLAASYKALNQPDQALEYQEQLLILKDSTSNLEKEKLVEKLYRKYEAQQQEATMRIEREKDQQLIQQLEHENSLKLLGLIFIFCILGLTTFAYQQSKKKNQLLQKDLSNKAIIEKQAIELQKIDQLKSRLFANISHELRTPLTMITGPVKQLLQDKNTPEASLLPLQIIAANSHQLLQLSNQISELSNNELGTIKTQVVKFHFHDLLTAIIPSFSLLAKNKGIQFLPPVYVDKDILLVTDAEKLFIILKNLLDNAIKYTTNGGQVSLNYINQQNHLQISIVDNGKGIPPTDLPHIFDRYYQAKNDLSMPQGGFGIGLALCQEYITLLKGTLKVNSTINQGSTFTVLIPKIINKKLQIEHIPHFCFAAYNTTIPKQVNLMPTSKDSQQELEDHLLIVEDNIDMCHYLGCILEEDYALICVKSGQEALEHLAHNSPSLIITDLMMATMDGITLVEKIKAQDNLGGIPILMLTANNSISSKQNALRVGVDDYLLKPFEENELKTRIAYLRNLADNRKELAEQEHTSEKKPTSTSFKSLSKENQAWLARLEEVTLPLIGNFDLNLDQITTHLHTSKTQLNRRVKEITGMTPKKYINELRFKEARRLLENKELHSVKAAAYSVGFKSLKYFSRNFKSRFGKYPSEYVD